MIKLKTHTVAKILCLLVLINFEQLCYGQNAKELIVERYRISDYGGEFIKPKTDLLERRKYSPDNNLVYVISYSGKLFFDSISYKFKHDTLVGIVKWTNFSDRKIKKLEDVRFFYNKGSLDYNIEVETSKKVVDPEEIAHYSEYLNKNIPYKLKDSLGLINQEIRDLNIPDAQFLSVKHLKNGLIRKEYGSIVPLPNILLEYGVPHNTFLQRFFIYQTASKVLIKDEFIYEDVKVVRDYNYLNDLVKSITVVVTNIHSKKIERHDVISFVYNYD